MAQTRIPEPARVSARSRLQPLTGLVARSWLDPVGKLWTLGRALVQGWAIARGSAIPLLALVISWVVGASQEAGVTAALWTAVVTLFVFELLAGIRAKSTPGELVLKAAVGVTLGSTILAVKAVLHWCATDRRLGNACVVSAHGGEVGYSQLRGGLPRTRAALEYAGRLHAGQSRVVDGAPFSVHPREVASLLYKAGAQDHLIAAGALHDVLEGTPVLASDLRRYFGWRIATLVTAVGEDERIAGYVARRATLRHRVAEAGEEALMLFAADKISKARELHLDRVEPEAA
jgi:hypothetical protein